MIDIQPGDVVKYIGNGPFLRPGSIHRVRGTFWFPGNDITDACVGLFLVGYPDEHRPGVEGFAAWRFRKIRPASDEFIHEVRACKPIKILERAQ